MKTHENCEIFLIIFNHDSNVRRGETINDCYGRVSKISKKVEKRIKERILERILGPDVEN